MTDKILVTRALLPDKDDYISEIADIWDSHWLTNMGEKHKKLQMELKKYLMVDEIELLSNGHMALELSIQSLELSGEVITTPFTFASTTHAIVRNGLTPVFCDINPEDYTIDVNRIEELITDKTCAIVPVHVYGNVCDVEAIEEIAKKHNLKVIYDAAHSFGESYKGRGIGSFGDVSIFSFHATKVFNTIEGGAACYSNPEFGKRLYQLKNFGIKNEVVVDGIGANAKMNEFSAAMGLCNLRILPESIERRKHIVELYREYLSGIDGIVLSKPQKDVVSNYSYMPVIFDESSFDDRDSIAKRLAENEIYARKYFYPLTNEFDCYHGWFDPDKTPVAKKISRQVLTLPLFDGLTDEQVERICRIIKA